jgi:site-specific recombinase XerD
LPSTAANRPCEPNLPCNTTTQEQTTIHHHEVPHLLRKRVDASRAIGTPWPNPAASNELYWAHRIEVLIGFARYCKIFDPQTEIPPRRLFGPAHRRKTPYIYSCRQLEELLSAGRQLSWDGELHTYSTLFGLLACTGLRISEAAAYSFLEVVNG